MGRLYASPLRVYLVIAFLAAIGIWVGTKLPVSLFPNSSQPRFYMGFDFGSLSADDFKRLYGDALEANLQNIKTGSVEVERVEVTYRSQRFSASIICRWGSDADAAKREIELIMSAAASSMPEDIRRSQRLGLDGGESGMFVVSFTSPKHTLDELHQLLEPLLIPEIRRLRDVGTTELYNPSMKEVRLELQPEVLAQLNLTTRDVEAAVVAALGSRSGGDIASASGSLPIQVPRMIHSIEDISQLMIPLRNGRSVPLAELARVRYDLSLGSARSFKLNGVSMIMLVVTPKPGANLKRMADEAKAVVDRIKASLPSDIEAQVTLDPSEFISSAVANVLKEVIVGSLLASLILFLFIGSFRNVATAAIEIPISIALAFIMMWFFKMNMNLFSLAGLALAAGMNVDASVVVMENIFRHFEGKEGRLSFEEKLKTIQEAVSEVKLPIIASTLASLVVFVPFMFISGLSYAILGDLAKAVVFSHGFSAAVALILVPTVRLHLMRRQTHSQHEKAPADKLLSLLESAYIRVLEFFMRKPSQAVLILGLPLLILAALSILALPRLPREIVGKPEADWLGIHVQVEGHTKLRQMEGFVEALHHDIKQRLPDVREKTLFAFDQIHGPHSAQLLFKIKSKADMSELHKRLEKAFPSGNGQNYSVFEWTPSEFRLPEPNALRVVITGGEVEDRFLAARDLTQSVESLRVVRDIESRPDLDRQSRLQVTIDPMQQAMLSEQGLLWNAGSISETLRVATRGKWLGQLMLDGRDTAVTLAFAEDAVQSAQDIEAFPMNLGGRILPLKVLAQVEEQTIRDKRFSENGQEMLIMSANLPLEKQADAMRYEKILEDHVRQWQQERLPQLGLRPVAVNVLEPNRELTDGMQQLRLAFSWSLLLLFFAIILQFGSLTESILVLVAVPLGLLGAILSLFVFQSTLSVNAILGMILLNGIAVNNSIILVDFTRRLYAEGLSPQDAVLQAARKRLRPILITTLTTILAMLPIASGYGEGGRVLQPLGIAVVGGLWLSTLLTLLLVPLLHSLRLKVQGKRSLATAGVVAALGLVLLVHPFGSRVEARSLNADQQKLLAMIDELIEKDPEWLKSESQIRQQEETLPALKGAVLPEVSADLRREHVRLPAENFEQQTSINGSARINLYRFGQDSARWSEAEATANALDQERRIARLEAETRITNLVFDLWAFEDEAALTEKIRRLRERLLKVAQQQYERGLLAIQDRQKIDLDRQSIELSARESQQKVSMAREALLSLQIKELPAGKWFLKDPQEFLPRNWEQRLSEPSLNEAVQKHPRSIAGTARLRAAEARTSNLWADQTPSLDLMAEVGRALGKKEPNDLSSQFALVLTVPLLDRFQASSSYRSQQEAQAAQSFELQRIRRELRLDLENQLQSFRRNAEAMQLRANFVLTARGIYEAGLQRFERGLVSVNELSTDEDRLYSYEREHNEDIRLFHKSLVAACHSYGFPLGACLQELTART